jgi:hypothetical protein
MSENRTLFFPDAGLLTLLRIEKRKINNLKKE